MTDSILTIEHVSKSYTGHKALNDVSLVVLTLTTIWMLSLLR